MDRLNLPQALEHIRRKITLIEDRLAVIAEGIDLYQQLADNEAEPLQRYQYRELCLKKQEEQVLYQEQLHSQQVYLSEFEKDLENQRQLRELQLQQMAEHLDSFLATADNVLQQYPNLPAQDKVILTSIKAKFAQPDELHEDEKISLFRELVNTLQKLTKS